jgi:son of sevenless-like protein
MHTNTFVPDAGTLPKLIEHATEQDSLSISTLVLTYPQITDALMRLLKTRFNTIPTKDCKHDELYEFAQTKLLYVRRRVVQFLREWMLLCPEDLDDENLLAEIRTFGNAIHFHNLRLKKIPELPSSLLCVKPRVIVPSTTAPPIIKPSFKLFRKEMNILDYDAEEIARQLTLLTHEYICSINRNVCLNQNWCRPRRVEHAPVLMHFLQHFNKISVWVAFSIVRQQNMKKRVKVLKKMLDIAENCEKLANVNDLFCIMYGIETDVVRRLEETFAELDDVYQNKHQHLLQLLSRDRGTQNVRRFYQNASPPKIPYIGFILTDLTFSEEGSSSYVYLDTLQMVNFAKLRTFASIIRFVREIQTYKYDLQICPELRELLLNAPVEQDKIMYQMSLKLEPRASKKNK